MNNEGKESENNCAASGHVDKLVRLFKKIKIGKNMDTYRKHIELLGFEAEDKITGFKGTIDSICFDLYGCVQASVRPKVNKDGTVPDGCWFDVTRLNINTENRVVNMPNFYEGYVAEGKKGAADKPTKRA